jgi:hypothetical protein
MLLHVRRQDLHRLCRWRTGWLQASDLLAVSLSVDLYMREARCKGLRAGLPARSRRMTWYVPQQQGHAALRGPLFKGLTCEHGIEFRCKSQRIFSRQAAEHRFTVWVSPALYGQFFKADVYTKAADKRFRTVRPVLLTGCRWAWVEH